MKFWISESWSPVFANDNDAFIPEVWAQESLMILENNLVMAALVHRDFSNEIAQFGDTVNTRRPSKFYGVRKTDDDAVTTQDAVATNVPVKLDQHNHVSFVIKDGEESKGFKNLREVYLEPAVMAIAQSIDEMLASQVYRFLANVVGKLGTTITKDIVIDAREKLNINQCPVNGRNMVVTPTSEGQLLNIADFVSAEKVGDEGSALREGSLGRKFGLSFFMDQNAPSVAVGNTLLSGAINNGNLAAGSTVLTVNGFTGTVPVGAWCTIAGDMIPHIITAKTDSSGDLISITISPGLATAVVHTAVVTCYVPGAVNYGAGYAAGYTKQLVINGFSVAPKKGQLVSFGATTSRYGVIQTPTGPSTTKVDLDRALYAAVANADVVGIGPAGNFNFGFHRNALTFVSRPLAAPQAGTGALSYVANYNGIGLRVTITYDGSAQGHRVTVDMLCGVEVLDANLGVVMLG